MRALPWTLTARLCAVAFEAAEAWLAFGIDLAAVECLAFVIVTEDFVGRIELGKTRGRLRIGFVGVGMQLLGELAEGALHLRFVRTLRYPQDLVGVPHSACSVKSPRPAGD